MDLKIVPLEYHEQMALAETIGYATQSRERWRQAVTVASVREIAGRKVLKPTHASHIRNALRDLGDDGYAQAARAVWSHEPEGEAPAVVVKPLTVLEQWDVVEFSGPAFDIPVWSGLALMACMVREYDGNALEFPKDKKELRERVKLLGWHGMAAAQRALRPADDDTDE